MGDKRAVSVIERPTVRAHRELAAVLREGDLAIDATAGNGHDTVFLAERVGESGRVIAFDIQAEAIASSRVRADAAGLTSRIAFVRGSHTLIGEYVQPGTAAAVVFNLGYLPGGDHSVITRSGETLLALDRSLVALRQGGLLAIVCYPGHPGGDTESEDVVAWAKRLETALCRTEIVRREGTLRPAPFLILVKKH